MNKFGVFYTRKNFSDLLIRTISNHSPKSIIDLGVGSGELLRAAFERWTHASFYGFDIDQKKINKLISDIPNLKFEIDDCLTSYFSSKSENLLGKIDIAVCNPPFLKSIPKTDYSKLLNLANLSECCGINNINSSLIFLAKNICLLKTYGELGIILPDSVISGHEYFSFRESLTRNHNVKCIIQLPEYIYSKTDAKTHILILQKGLPTTEKVKIYLSDKVGNYVDCLSVPIKSLFYRMDYNFHKAMSSIGLTNVTFEQLGLKIIRGNKSHKELKGLNASYFHTTTFPRDSYTFNSPKILDNINCTHAEDGDIVIARVGTRCIGRVAIIQGGKIPISDCIYKIVTPPYLTKIIFNNLISDRGQEYLKMISHGVCAKLISKRDLLNFPVEI